MVSHFGRFAKRVSCACGSLPERDIEGADAPNRLSEALSYSDNVRVVAFLHAAQGSISAGAVLDAKHQFGVRQCSEGKRQIEA